MDKIEIISTKDLSSGRDVIQLVHLLTPIKSSIYIKKNDRSVNAKSILGLLSIAVKKGDQLTVQTGDNEDYEEIKRAFTKFFLEE